MSEEKEFKFDKVDQGILNRLLDDSRRPFQDIAREMIISGGTVHVRVNKMKEAGIIKGSKLVVDFSKLGMEVVAFVGVNLVSAKDYPVALKKLKKFPQITEVHYTTGTYSMFVKVVTKSTRDLHLFLIEKLQSISEIQSTETLISLDSPIMRDPEVPKPEE